MKAVVKARAEPGLWLEVGRKRDSVRRWPACGQGGSEFILASAREMAKQPLPQETELVNQLPSREMESAN